MPLSTLSLCQHHRHSASVSLYLHCQTLTTSAFAWRLNFNPLINLLIQNGGSFGDMNMPTLVYRACELLSNTDLCYIFAETSIDTCWSHWKEVFFDIVNICIPKSILPDRRSIPWMTKQIVQAIRKRNYYYRKARQTNCAIYLDKYKQLRSRITFMLRQ